MKLQTQMPLTVASNQIDYQSFLWLLGSCFAENIEKKLEQHKFNVLGNPFGILFHPTSIERLLSRAVSQNMFTEKDLFFLNERWHCFEVHSDLSNAGKEDLLHSLNRALGFARQTMAQCTHILITLGTAWGYRHLYSGALVANCHKVPQREFEKELLSLAAIEECLENILGTIRTINPKAQLIFTISPVRHLKDGFIENQRSKSHLIASLGNWLATKSATEQLHYFPAYELMMDELRDYRFYEADMLHPNAVAIAYIWEKFKRVWISQKAFAIMDQVEEIQKSIQHRPFHPESEKHQRFRAVLREKIKGLEQRHPHMRFDGPEPD
ncbi:MAG: GSCFA domain-containing protein [Flavobacteriales bacterium]|nr:MAG: GSCFA domain-containing protein [Flavobacteriales bacterium]